MKFEKTKFYRVLTIIATVLAVITVLLDPLSLFKGCNTNRTTEKKADTLYIPTVPPDTNHHHDPKLDTIANDVKFIKDAFSYYDSLDKVDSHFDPIVIFQSIDLSKKVNSSLLNNLNIKLGDDPPAKGYGKFVLRAYCDYITPWGYITITSGPNVRYFKDVLKHYDSLDKKETTISVDLPPGNYLAYLNYGMYGTDTLNVQIESGKVSFYKFKKINPYGSENGRVVLYSDRPKKYKVTVDKTYLGEITIGPDGFYRTLVNGHHQILIENIISNDLDYNVDPVSFSLSQGEFLPIKISN